MIRIRYSPDLEPGLNGRAQRDGRTTVVYLLPGLTPAQRGATLRRLRQHGRMDISPPLPAAELLVALIADRIRTTFGQAGAIVRTHPAGSTLPVVVVSAAMAGFLLLSAVSIRIIHMPPGIGARAGAAPFGAQPNPRDRAQPGQPEQPDQPASAPGIPGGPAAGGGASDGHGPGPSSAPSPNPAVPTPTTGASPGAASAGVTSAGVTSTGGGSAGGGTPLSNTATSPPLPGPVIPLLPAPVVPVSAPGPVPASIGPSTQNTQNGSNTQNVQICVGVSSLGFCLSL